MSICQLHNISFRYMDNNEELKDRKRIIKQIAKTSELIRKKYRALKTE